MARPVLERGPSIGAGRILDWQPEEGHRIRTPELIVPETRRFGVPDDAKIVLTAAPQGREGVLELHSGGTWFHPADGDTAWTVEPPTPGPTHQMQVLDVRGELAVMHDAAGWASDPKRLLPAFLDAKSQAGPARAFYAPGLGTPADYAVWAYLGVDLFDASPLMLAAVRGQALTPDGALEVDQADGIHACGTSPEALWRFNLDQARTELARIRHAIKAGALRQLAERRAYVLPATTALLRRFDQEHAYLESAAPVHGDHPVPCMTQEALWMPEVERFRQRLRDGYTPPASADVLVLLPCSARKPYKLSKTHRYFQRALDDSGIRHRVHEVMVTSPLGLVPRELEETYPAHRYDVPVTGRWNRDEEAIIRTQTAAILDVHDYAHVVAHVPASTFTFLRDLLPDGTLHTAQGRPSSIEDCQRLRDTLRGIRDGDRRAGGSDAARARKLEDLAAIASYQFGPDVAADLVDGAHAKGRTPFLKLLGPEGQRGMTSDGRGMLSLTLEGAAIVARHRTKRVRIADFEIRKTGSLFSVGVEAADPDIRPGDDVVVVHGDEVRACGIAQMGAAEMEAFQRGVAVNLRHVAQPEHPVRREVVAQ